MPRPARARGSGGPSRAGAGSPRCRRARRAISSSIWKATPFAEPARGLEFLFGVLTEEEAGPRYHALWAHEPSAIKRLMGEHATRELEVDELLRRRIFVDVHTVFRQALRAGVPSYSLKDLEELGGFRRAAPVRSGTEAILEYEGWRESEPRAARGSAMAHAPRAAGALRRGR